MRQQFVKDGEGIFQTCFYRNNTRIVPTSAQMTVYMPASAVKLIDGAAMDIAADGLITYALSAADNVALGCDYKAVIAYMYETVTNHATVFYDVVISALRGIITDDDIVAELPQIKEGGWKVRGQAESGSASTLVSSELKRYGDGYFTGGLAYSVDKAASRVITGFVSATGTVTTEPFSAPITTDKFILTRSYTREIGRAFEKLEERLKGMGRRPHLVLDPEDLREAHVYASVAEVCKGMMTESDALWWRLWKEYEKKTDDAFGAMNFKYDATNDGLISGAERVTRASKPRTVRR
ncbi:MAG: hypothetical protein HZB85_02160 [Deltaproteobacteria bacterium]|nr:hypothetical protein [Deltaproteobacteria bacterium]